MKSEQPKMDMQVSVEPMLYGVHWIMHEHDADINDPSCPHCHAKEKNWKLNIYTGEIFDYTNGKTYIGKISKKEMKKLWNQKGFINLVARERKWYEDTYCSQNSERFPKLPAIPSAKKHGKYIVRISKRWMRNIRKK